MSLRAQKLGSPFILEASPGWFMSLYHLAEELSVPWGWVAYVDGKPASSPYMIPKQGAFVSFCPPVRGSHENWPKRRRKP